jgi:hypothetical protein
MRRLRARLGRGWPAVAAVAAGALLGLAAASAAAAPLAAAWSAYVVPAFGGLLSTLYLC